MIERTATAGYLLANGGRVRWRCDTGHHHGDVDLGPIIERLGRDYDLSDRWPPCRVSGCPGIVEFIDGNSMWPRKLTRLSVNSPDWHAFHDRRRAELEAEGYRVEMGKWVSPDTKKPPPPVRTTTGARTIDGT